jgi:hypothetical protein
MIAISITPATYQCIKAALLDPQAPPPPNPDGLIPLWLDRKFVDELDRLRHPGETYGDVILRMAT